MLLLAVHRDEQAHPALSRASYDAHGDRLLLLARKRNRAPPRVLTGVRQAYEHFGWFSFPVVPLPSDADAERAHRKLELPLICGVSSVILNFNSKYSPTSAGCHRIRNGNDAK